MIRTIMMHSTTEVEKTQKAAAIRDAGRVPKPRTQLIEALLDNLDFVTPEAERHIPLNPMSNKKNTLWPAYDALMEIGRPVVPVILDRLALTDNLTKHRREVLLLVDIEGKEALRIVEEAAAVSEKRALRLKQTAEIVKQAASQVEDRK